MIHTKQPGGISAANETEKKKKVEQFDPNGGIVKQIKDDIVPGVFYVLSEWRPSVVVDCHMHIESGNCAPLPFLWKQIADKSIGLVEAFQLKRESMEILGIAGGSIANFVTRNPLLGEKVQTQGNDKPEYRKNSLLQTIPESRKSTYEIADGFVAKRMEDVYQDILLPSDLYQGITPVFFCIAMTMDMEYAHLDGYYGFKVYNVIYEDDDPEKKPTRYWTPLHGRWIKKSRGNVTYYVRDDHPLPQLGMDEQTSGVFEKNKDAIKSAGLPGIYYNEKKAPVRMSVQAVPFLLDDAETDRYEQWKTQLAETEFAMLANPLKLLPLFHYDPRRWQVASNPPGNTHPFEQVGESGLYLGFKMYTAQGYQPYDVDRLPIMSEFYARCATERIPVMNHCTPNGAPTFDRDQYIHFTHPMDSPEFRSKKLDAGGNALKYFSDNFVSPKAWEKVLENHPTLRICLAHFGGGTDLGLKWFDEIIKLMEDYSYVYADISSSMADPKHKERFKAHFKDCYEKEMKTSESTVRERILFGTDWYMTLLDGVDYPEYFNTTKTFLDSFDNDLWFQMTQVNPYDFYRLDEQIERIAGNIVEKRKQEIVITTKVKNQKVQKKLPPLIQKEVDVILDEAAYIRIANQYYSNYRETP